MNFYSLIRFSIEKDLGISERCVFSYKETNIAWSAAILMFYEVVKKLDNLTFWKVFENH